MEFENKTFDFEVYCNMCGSEKYEIESYDSEGICIVCTECGNKDKFIFMKEEY